MRSAKLKIGLALFACSILLTACGAGGPGADIVLKINKKETPMTVKTAVYTKYDPVDLPSGKRTQGYSFILSNFETDKELDKYGPDLTTAGQIKVQFALNVLEGETKEMKLKPETYKYSASMDAPEPKLGSFRVFTFADGKEDIWARMGGTKDSFVKLTSVTDDTVSGEIVLQDGDDSVKGKFTAKVNKK
ncbi:MAG: hypothetical protein IPI64_02170 [Chloracidobacterium sp.]|nr:hypothetical protein [Chloracidobacterium sp.]